MLRAAWNAQELLTTFQDDIHSVTLIPSKPPSPGGTFIVKLKMEYEDEIEIWNRKQESRFPESKELKQRIRDLILPDRDLGHSDVKGNEAKNVSSSPSKENDCQDCDAAKDHTINLMDDDDAEDMRNFFGVA